MKGKFVLFVLVAAIAVVVLAGCSSATPAPVVAARVFKFSLSASESSAWFNGAAKFAELVKQRSNGKYAVSVFANSTLSGGDQTKEVTMVQDGTIDFAYIATNRLEAIDPRFQSITLPWLFANSDDVDKKLLNGPMGQELLKAVEAKNLIGLAWAENGFRQVTNSKREIKTPADVKGLKMRVASGNVFASTFKTLGATTTSIQLGDLYNGLRDGLADGQDNSVDVITANKFMDVQKFVTMWNYSYGALFHAVSKKTWDSMDADAKKLVTQAALDAATFQVQENRKATNAHIQTMKDKGMTITNLTADQVNAFRTATAPVYTEFEATIGKDFMSKYVAAK
jgi:tripartite ATP-independent transporter DctP family solute receptor